MIIICRPGEYTSTNGNKTLVWFRLYIVRSHHDLGTGTKSNTFYPDLHIFTQLILCKNVQIQKNAHKYVQTSEQQRRSKDEQKAWRWQKLFAFWHCKVKHMSVKQICPIWFKNWTIMFQDVKMCIYLAMILWTNSVQVCQTNISY